jgi:hypothetical protein
LRLWASQYECVLSRQACQRCAYFVAWSRLRKDSMLDRGTSVRVPTFRCTSWPARIRLYTVFVLRLPSSLAASSMLYASGGASGGREVAGATSAVSCLDFGFEFVFGDTESFSVILVTFHGKASVSA